MFETLSNPPHFSDDPQQNIGAPKDSLEIVLNGQKKCIPPGTSLSGLIQNLGLSPKWVVAEWNGQALAKKDYDETVLAQGDRVELVRAVSGG